MTSFQKRPSNILSGDIHKEQICKVAKKWNLPRYITRLSLNLTFDQMVVSAVPLAFTPALPVLHWPKVGWKLEGFFQGQGIFP